MLMRKNVTPTGMRRYALATNFMGPFASITGAETAPTTEFGRHVFEIAALSRAPPSLYNYRVMGGGGTWAQPRDPPPKRFLRKANNQSQIDLPD
jgi:hypothetical protein